MAEIDLHDGRDAVGSSGASGSDPLLIELSWVEALDPSISGAKAAALARAALAGLDTLPGVVLTTRFSRDIDSGARVEQHPAVRQAYERAGGDQLRLVARSSSVVEDLGSSSAAGQFASVVGIETVDELAAAVTTVLGSRHRAGASDHPIAVLIQPMLDPDVGGVLFGVDPVSGRSDRLVVTAVRGSVGDLVSGNVDGSRYELDPGRRIVERQVVDGASLSSRQLHRLAGLSDRLTRVFDGPQDIEWAIDADDRLWVFQSRPVTTEVRGVPSGPVLGPGPVAETFPEALFPLEADLWVPPLREAIASALELAHAAPIDRIAASPVVVVVDGFVALDLEVTGEDDHEPTVWERVNPATKLRQLRSAWKVGRLRSALPRLAADLTDRTDADLESFPPISRLTDRQIVGLLGRGRSALRALHGHEVLMGLLTDVGSARMTGASVAMRVLAESRSDGSTDGEIVAKSPIVLALTSPRIGPMSELPPSSDTADLPAPDPDTDGAAGPTDTGVLREALRLRVRWVQELMARAAWELGCRLVDAGQLERREQVRSLSLDDLIALVTKRASIVGDLDDRLPSNHGRPLPARFQLSDTGRPVPVRGRGTQGGTGAGGGVGRGLVTFDTTDPPLGSVLVVRTFTPGLGPQLGKLAAIVSETGSVLSHLAILAREQGVPAVVGHRDATTQLAEGTMIEVDGDSGRVELIEEVEV